MKNWSLNIDFNAAAVHEPTTIDELQSIVARAPKAKALGSAHSFNTIADTGGDMISMAGLDRVIGVDREAKTVTVEGGISYGALGPLLHSEGSALRNLASQPQFTIAGACATATHGSGDGNRGLATQVVSVDLITGTGDLVTIDDDDEDFAAVAVGLGAFGAIARATLAVTETYDVAQELHLDLPLSNAIDHLDEIFASAYSVSYFTDFRSNTINQLWRKHHLEPGDGRLPQTPDRYFGATRAAEKLAPSGAKDADRVTDQLLESGPWFERLPHGRFDVPLEPGSQLQSEYFVEREDGPAALAALAELGPVMSPVMVMGEVRTVAGDELWLSPYPTDSLALHLSWTTDWAAVRPVLREVEAALAPFAPRPHWGKLYEMESSSIVERYPRFGDWAAAVERLDPAGVFRNPFLDDLLAA
ncbi:MAG: FAD-binding protein [Acidimicrobiales bacterium]